MALAVLSMASSHLAMKGYTRSFCSFQLVRFPGMCLSQPVAQLDFRVLPLRRSAGFGGLPCRAAAVSCMCAQATLVYTLP
jgi:hypothetical protein